MCIRDSRRVVDGLGPLAGEGGAQASQLFFQMVVQTELVIDDDAAQIVDLSLIHICTMWFLARLLILSRRNNKKVWPRSRGVIISGDVQ